MRKRFCRKFNFELQAAATEDAIVLSLGHTHSFPLDEVFNYLQSRSVRSVLTQAVLTALVVNVKRMVKLLTTAGSAVTARTVRAELGWS